MLVHLTVIDTLQAILELSIVKATVLGIGFAPLADQLTCWKWTVSAMLRRVFDLVTTYHAIRMDKVRRRRLNGRCHVMTVIWCQGPVENHWKSVVRIRVGRPELAGGSALKWSPRIVPVVVVVVGARRCVDRQGRQRRPLVELSEP